MDKPSISVIVPVFNRPDLVIETIRSVQAQSLGNWELILVDDHSTDETPEVVRQLAANDDRIRFYRRQSQTKGPAACRNEGIGHATSELIVFLDSDDLLAPHCLERRVAYMREQGAGLDFAVFQTEVFREAPGDIGLCFNRLDYENDIEHFLLGDNCWITTGPLWRKAVLAAVGGWNEALLGPDDWELTLRVLLRGCRYQKVDIVDSYFRMNNVERKSVSGQSGEQDHICNGLQAIDFVNHHLHGVEKESEYRDLLRYQAYIRCYDLCATHHHGAYAWAATRLFRRGIFRLRDLTIAYAIALMGALMDRLSLLTDHLVWQRFRREREIFQERWQYKWVCPTTQNESADE
jgi:glycosyltransferase involved in cell wall biosynthesis